MPKSWFHPCNALTYLLSVRQCTLLSRHPLLQIGPFVPVPKDYLSRFWNRDSAAGTKALVVEPGFVPDWAICPSSKGLFVPVPWGLLSRVVEPGQKVPHAKKSLRHVEFEPKTYCLAHGFLTNSPK